MTFVNTAPVVITRTAFGTEVAISLVPRAEWTRTIATTQDFLAERNDATLVDDLAAASAALDTPHYVSSTSLMGVRQNTAEDVPQALVDGIVDALDDKFRTPSAIAKRASAKSRYGQEVPLTVVWEVLDGLDEAGLTTNKGNGKHRKYAAPAPGSRRRAAAIAQAQAENARAQEQAEAEYDEAINALGALIGQFNATQLVGSAMEEMAAIVDAARKVGRLPQG